MTHCRREVLHVADDPKPSSWEDLWSWTAQKFRDKEAAHLDETLLAIGDRVTSDPPTPLSDADHLLLEAWKDLNQDDKERFAHLFMRSVGHQEFDDL